LRPGLLLVTGTTNKSAFDLRPARAGDHPALIELLEANKLPLAGVPDTLEHFFVAEADGRAIGTIGLEKYGQYGLLRSAAVASDWQGRGVGRTLVERLLDYSRSLDLTAIYLLTTTAEEYFPAFGFSAVSRSDVPLEVQESVEFTSACPASAAVLSLQLR
jgi:amino-acid N-acetyltransferase